MPTINEIITNAKAHLREIAGDAVSILKKGNDKVVDKLEEMKENDSKGYKSAQEALRTMTEPILSQIKGVEKAVKSQKNAESISINNPEEITDRISEGLSGVIKTLQTELKNFDKNIVVKNDFSNFASLFKSSQDKKSIIEALKKIEDKLDKPEVEKEDIDYTMILSDIAKAVENKEAVEVLNKILEKELNITFPNIQDVNLNPNLIEDHRIRTVLPDEQVAKMSKAIQEGSNTRLVVDNQVNGDQKTQIVDGAGNVIDSHPDADGDAHLGTSIIQNILTSTSNSTTANLASGATFTGAAEETFGINGIQIFHSADQDCTIYVDQGLTNSFGAADTVTDSFPCLANTPCTRTYTSVSPYFRIRITNNGASSTTVINSAAGMTPVINPLPRSLSEDERLTTESTLTGQQNKDRHVWVSPTNALTSTSEVRLVGTNFDGQTKDTNFWTEAVTGSGSVTQDGEIQLDTGATANSTASYTSVRKARFVVGSANHFIGAFKFVTEGTADNVRRCGAYLATDGFFFQLDGTTFSVGTRKNSTDTLVNSGDFNGNYGPNFTPLNTNYYKLDIEWTPVAVFFYVNGVLLHKIGGGHLSDILTLPIAFENINDNGATADIAFDCLGVVIMREGELQTNATFKYITGAASTLCKVGAGDLHTVVVTNNAGSITVYDGVDAGGNLISVIDSLKVQGTLSYNAPFSDGLFIVTTGATIATITYE